MYLAVLNQRLNAEMALYRFNQYLISCSLRFDDMDIDSVEAFFKAMGYTLSARHNCANHLRQLFHYLYEHGYTSADHALFVLKDQYKDQCKLPTTYTEEEISKVLAAIERSSAIGKRDYLIVLLAAEYGWRSGDIVSFRFSQIDWDNNRISFSQDKTDVPAEYPLLSSVGNAIIDYLKYSQAKDGCPGSDCFSGSRKTRDASFATDHPFHCVQIYEGGEYHPLEGKEARPPFAAAQPCLKHA